MAIAAITGESVRMDGFVGSRPDAVRVPRLVHLTVLSADGSPRFARGHAPERSKQLQINSHILPQKCLGSFCESPPPTPTLWELSRNLMEEPRFKKMNLIQFSSGYFFFVFRGSRKFKGTGTT